MTAKNPPLSAFSDRHSLNARDILCAVMGHDREKQLLNKLQTGAEHLRKNTKELLVWTRQLAQQGPHSLVQVRGINAISSAIHGMDTAIGELLCIHVGEAGVSFGMGPVVTQSKDDEGKQSKTRTG